ncbi:hypothetical protein AcW2_006282 [Taiwanofungus camphoratus]|nr:hypothetical protein AcW2_006282 [Antrodia cinnamomea]
MPYTEEPRRRPRVRFADDTLLPSDTLEVSRPQRAAIYDSRRGSSPQLTSVYHDNHPSNHRHSTPEVARPHTQLNISSIPLGGAPSDAISHSRRGSDESGDSGTTLYDEPDYSMYSLSSYRHPYDIQRPDQTYSGGPSSWQMPDNKSEKSQNEMRANGIKEDEDESDDDITLNGDRRRGYLSNLIDLYGLGRQNSGEGAPKLNPNLKHSTRPFNLHRVDTASSENDQVLDPDDPTVTGAQKNILDEEEDVEKARLRQMSYKERREYRSRIRIEFNIASVLNRQLFLMRLAKALMTFGAPSHRIESQLVSAARILEVDAEFIHIPGVIICSFGDQETRTSETHFVKCSGRLALGSLHEVHQIYRSVVHDEISAKKATVKLNELLDAKPIYGTFTRIILAFFISALICPLAFGGSFADMWIAGVGAILLCSMQIGLASKSQLYANVFEITVTIIISFLARGLSSIRSQIFCYTAISSAGIVGILPGYLILSSSLELGSKNIVCGSVKMVYALIYTLFLAFGLQIGSDFYLLFDENARHELAALAARMTSTISITGVFVADNTTIDGATNDGNPLTGTFTFTNSTPFIREHIIDGCYRPPTFPWYLQPFPWWSQFIIVPIFSVLSSLSNLQPVWTWDLVVMVVISCVSYAANKIANHFIFGRSDIVSSIGAFAVGLLGNLYSRRMGGTAFTAMVTGVLFLVPSGLSQAGGITAQGNGIDIGSAMIAVTIGITVGLFMSQALVYTFGTRKNAAVFSF